MQVRKSESTTSEFVTKKVSIRAALHEIGEQLKLGVPSRALNPIVVFSNFFGYDTLPSLTPYTLTCKANCKTIRGFINSYVQKRKCGEIKS